MHPGNCLYLNTKFICFISVLPDLVQLVIEVEGSGLFPGCKVAVNECAQKAGQENVDTGPKKPKFTENTQNKP